MAYDWFRVDTAMVDHPKVLALAKLMDRPQAGWYVIRLWAWANRYAANGLLQAAALPAIERYCGWGGKPGRLVSAMVEVGLVDDDEGVLGGVREGDRWGDSLGAMGVDPRRDGVLRIHDWGERQGALVEKSERDAERKREDRKKRHAPPSEPGARTRRDGTRRDETRRDETNEKKKKLAAAPKPASDQPEQATLLDVAPPEPSDVTPEEAPAPEPKKLSPAFDMHESWESCRWEKLEALGLEYEPEKLEPAWVAAFWSRALKQCRSKGHLLGIVEKFLEEDWPAKNPRFAPYGLGAFASEHGFKKLLAADLAEDAL